MCTLFKRRWRRVKYEPKMFLLLLKWLISLLRDCCQGTDFSLCDKLGLKLSPVHSDAYGFSGSLSFKRESDLRGNVEKHID